VRRLKRLRTDFRSAPPLAQIARRFYQLPTTLAALHLLIPSCTRRHSSSVLLVPRIVSSAPQTDRRRQSATSPNQPVTNLAPRLPFFYARCRPRSSTTPSPFLSKPHLPPPPSCLPKRKCAPPWTLPATQRSPCSPRSIQRPSSLRLTRPPFILLYTLRRSGLSNEG
jgi:hypothetical protein